MITKEQFLNGAEFKVNGIGAFKFYPKKQVSEHDALGTLEKTFYNSAGDKLFSDYECNVYKITNTSIKIYTTVVGINVDKTIKFEDMEEYITPKI